MSVSRISEGLDLEQSKVSHHLKHLRNCGFVTGRREHTPEPKNPLKAYFQKFRIISKMGGKQS